MEFWVKLIQVELGLSVEACKSLRANCTHVDGLLWLFEGDEWTLEEDGVKFKILDEQAIESTGGLSKEELIKLCKDTYCFDETLLDQ